MGARENKVEKYLDSEFRKLGGMTRKWVSPGVSGVPDRLCFIIRHVFLVEVKTDDGVLSQPQQREIDRLRSHGAIVHVVYGHRGVDEFIKEIKEKYL